MKKLRVLTGSHAGADLLLDAMSYTVSSHADADLQITDWTGPALHLTVAGDAESLNAATFRFESEGPQDTLQDLTPRRFGEIVLCIGAADAVWPSDLTLLQGLLHPAVEAAVQQPAETPRRQDRWLVVGAVAAVAIAGAYVTVVVDASRRAMPPPPSVLARAFRAVESTGLREISVRAAGQGVVVEGIVADATEAARLRAALADLPPNLIQDRFAAASELSRSIAEAMGAPGLSVVYLQRGEFLVRGSAVGADRLRPVADRLLADLTPLVTGIRLSVTDLPAPPRMPTGAMLQTEGMEYVQTRDGTKYLSLLDLPVTVLKDMGAGTSNRALAPH